MTAARDVLVLGDLDLNDGVNFQKLDGWDWGVYTNDRSQRQRLRGAADWSPARRDGWVECGGQVRVLASDDAGLVTALRNLQGELSKETNTLVAGPIDSLTVTMDVAPDPGDVPDDLRFTVARKPIIDLHFWRSPLTRLPKETVGPATLATPCVVDLTGMMGTHPTPLDLLFEFTDPNNVWFAAVAYIPGSEEAACAWADDGGWILEAEDMWWSAGAGYSNPEGGPAAQPANNGWCFNEPAATALDTQHFPPGPYEILARSFCTLGDTNSVGAQGLVPTADERYNRVGMAWYWPMGSICLPSPQSESGWAADLGIGFQTAGEWFMFDRFCFMPARWGYWRWHHAPAGSATRLRRVGDSVFADGACDLSTVSGSGFEAKDGRLLVVTQAQAAQNGSLGVHTASLTYSYDPLLTLW
ncbi:MAG TPA: hypothetical protein VMB75_01400 [Rhodocyclaceae bacterium]|nr:hypothetical protein [Rhodocyclaceae bacterium]